MQNEHFWAQTWCPLSDAPKQWWWWKFVHLSGCHSFLCSVCKHLQLWAISVCVCCQHGLLQHTRQNSHLKAFQIEFQHPQEWTHIFVSWFDIMFFQFLQALNIISAGHTSQKLSSVGTGTQNTSTVDGLSVLTFFPLPGNLIFCVGARTNLVFVNEFTASMTQLKPLLPILPIMCCSVWTLCSLLSPPQANSLAWIPWLVKRFDHCVWQWWCVCLSICPLFWWKFFVLCHVPYKVTC